MQCKGLFVQYCNSTVLSNPTSAMFICVYQANLIFPIHMHINYDYRTYYGTTLTFFFSLPTFAPENVPHHLSLYLYSTVHTTALLLFFSSCCMLTYLCSRMICTSASYCRQYTNIVLPQIEVINGCIASKEASFISFFLCMCMLEVIL